MQTERETVDPYAYSNLVALPKREKLQLFSNNGKIFHVIFSQQFTRENLEDLCELADQLRSIAQDTRDGLAFLNSLLRERSAMLYFTQPSTRTYLSFVRACQYLGMSYAEVRDPNVSSKYKGESEIDGVRTFSNYFDLIIMRHHQGGFAEQVAYLMNDPNRSLSLDDQMPPKPVISAGAGSDEHPTQALLDIYTLTRSFRRRPKTTGIDGKHIAFMGDVARGRTVRSLSQLLAGCYKNVRLTYIRPEALKLKDDIKAFLAREGCRYDETDRLEDVLGEVDAIYVTRIQDEYDTKGESAEIDYSKYWLTKEKADRMKKEAVVMHPLPRRAELDPAIDNDPRAAYWKQEINGMWIRAALIASLFNREVQVMHHYQKHHSY